MIRLAPLALLVLWCGCIQRVPRAHLASPAQIAVAYVVDPEHEGGETAPPPELKEAIAASLSERNFNVVEVSAGAGILSTQRMQAVEAAGLPYSLLVEMRVTFFNQIDGRWRWDVATRLIASQKGQPRAEDSFTAPAVLLFERQQGAEAISFVADPVAQRVGTLLDGVVSAQVPRADGGVATVDGLDEAVKRVEADKRDSIYFVMVDRFKNGDKKNDRDADPSDPAAFHGGDLAGLREHLDFIQGLGFHTVWLSPVFAMRQTKFNSWGAYHGYWTYQLDQLEPRFGTEAELKALADAIHARGMRLFLDVVLNHAGHDAPLAQEHPAWFHHNGSIQDWNDKQQLEDREVHGLPDFDQDNEEAYQYLLQSSLKWARLTKADGFRLDAVKHSPARFWKRFSTDVHQELGLGFVLLGEYLDSDVRQLAALQTEDGLDEVFDFPLAFAIDDVFCKRAPPSHLFAALSNDRLYRNPAGLVTLVDNHDLPRLASKCEDPARFDQALQALFSARGTPSIIWGTESRAAGAKDPDNRPDAKLDDAPAAGTIRKLLAERNDSPALYLGAPYLIEASEHVLAYLRVHRDQLALVVVNHSDKPWTPGSELTAAGFDAQPVPAGAFVTRVQPVTSGKWADFATRVDHLWRTGTPKRQVRFTVKNGEGICGSSPELGFWKPEAALKLSHGEVSVSLPVRSVVEFKLTRAGADGKPQWEKGDNRTLVVNEGDGPLVVPLEWRGS